MKQFNTPEDEGNEERERDLIHEALYNPELLKRQRKELKIVESRFVREEELMDEEYSSILRFNLYKEKLMIKKALEAENTDNPVLEQECDLIVEIINRQGFDDEYLEYIMNHLGLFYYNEIQDNYDYDKYLGNYSCENWNVNIYYDNQKKKLFLSAFWPSIELKYLFYTFSLFPSILLPIFILLISCIIYHFI